MAETDGKGRYCKYSYSRENFSSESFVCYEISVRLNNSTMKPSGHLDNLQATSFTHIFEEFMYLNLLKQVLQSIICLLAQIYEVSEVY